MREYPNQPHDYTHPAALWLDPRTATVADRCSGHRQAVKVALGLKGVCGTPQSATRSKPLTLA